MVLSQLNKLKTTTFLLLSGTILLFSSLSTRAMEEEKPDYIETRTKLRISQPRLEGIEIPSKPEEVGVKACDYSFPMVEGSWSDLSSFTLQTLRNFEQDKGRGILFVHSLEDIMGATQCFTKMWNRNHPEDQRTVHGENFHEVFSHKEFIDHYIEYVLAQRFLISGSVLAFNESPTFTLRSTFSPVNFIFDVPKECVVITALRDAGTPVCYAPVKDLAVPRNVDFERYAAKYASERITLDALFRFPELQMYVGSNAYYNKMNEVGVLSCAQRGEEYFRPNVVGVLINTSAPLPGFDHGNGKRNEDWAIAIEDFAKANNLPLLRRDEQTQATFNEEDAKMMANEWFDDRTDSLFSYAQNRDDFLSIEETSLRAELHMLVTQGGVGQDVIKEQPKFAPVFPHYFDDPTYVKKSQRFLLSDEQLETYGLKRE
ncbi:MAG: hypothetical protein BGO67_08655 [Alphaproteobacteria bacterium 41-28]|nr:MAG: hypothetical protein BGO67_08655 [Alphaproteobacteria bacterium 41-28]